LTTHDLLFILYLRNLFLNWLNGFPGAWHWLGWVFVGLIFAL